MCKAKREWETCAYCDCKTIDDVDGDDCNRFQINASCSRDLKQLRRSVEHTAHTNIVHESHNWIETTVSVVVAQLISSAFFPILRTYFRCYRCGYFVFFCIFIRSFTATRVCLAATKRKQSTNVSFTVCVYEMKKTTTTSTTQSTAMINVDFQWNYSSLLTRVFFGTKWSDPKRRITFWNWCRCESRVHID